ncbi:conserved Plasmodium protein, unknown function [Plasmodium knowlesi strain H]|uniref:Ribosomal silencing factor RsfS n=3 Tax=Plasmodium knowlesi TaxID=5850 RepID=A0A5K1UTQ4_PLAKH|nr:ribosomal silencing factor RsfS, putative [Plasmodium knowlesi strain H]OTN68354.1 Uncharacterized protein PKNOH_S03319500 [Plasmodium knowlesi]CAA9987097.1 ribosomal silencing factor RsfS, putative [Plasmodium knowlesi strain H]SBO23833.1 conserved Plasmodium protein, unknown function [Plasmodium knowlesi strain H]SBO25614.1 conserved Plasmodium protein, unknown function [Plasmodium knowlesi strain H]VVS76571.1 ribosomal silencing factor RsfS, putative [Plasmodium knowlesi strain H]|eukprot:XP_002261719.1 hypothetical protein, conserved in Plasmodium species [Plasmodium knowlesi strain H]
MFVRRFPICAPLSLARRYIVKHNKIFDKLKERGGALETETNENVCNEDKDDDKIEIINIDEKILRNNNIPWAEGKEAEEDNKDDLHREDEFYKNMKYFKNVDVRTFIQETIDYYTLKQLKGDEWTGKEGQQHQRSNGKGTTHSSAGGEVVDGGGEQRVADDQVTEGESRTTQGGTCRRGDEAEQTYRPSFEEKPKRNHRTGEKNYEGLTPAQRFYEENKEKLIAESMKQYNERRVKLDGGSNSHVGGHTTQGEELEEDYYHTQVTDPIVRPRENYLFDYEDDEEKANDDEDSEGDDSVELEKGVMPTIEQIVFILKHEKVKNIKVIDLDKCGRRDIGMFLILCTGETPKHNKRVGKLISRIFVDLEIPYISKVAYCYCNKFDDWIIAHCGPLKVHVVTKELRELYDLESLFLYPHEHFDSGNFPAFFDYTPGIPPPYIVRSNSSLDAYPNDELYRKFLTET